MDDRKQALLRAIETSREQLDKHTDQENTLRFGAKVEQQMADVRACIKRDGLSLDVEVIYAFERYENAVINAVKLDAAGNQAVSALRSTTRAQFNWNSEQESKAFSQMASFSEKLVVLSSSYLAVSVTLLGQIKSHLSSNQQLTGTDAYYCFLVLVITGTCLAALAQFAASNASHLILMHASSLQNELLYVDSALAYNSSLQEASDKFSQHKLKGSYLGSTTIRVLNSVTVALLMMATLAFGIFVALNVS